MKLLKDLHVSSRISLPFVLAITCLVFLSAFASFAQKRRVASAEKAAPPKVQSAPHIDEQTGLIILCKSATMPAGFSITGEMFADSCNGSAWIVKAASSAPGMPGSYGVQARRAFEQQSFDLPMDTATSFAEPNENILPGQCDEFSSKVKSVYNFNPANFNEEQRHQTSAQLDGFWNEVRASQPILLPCLRKELKAHTSGSFFAIDGSMLLVNLDPSPASKALQVQKFISANLDGSDLEYWVHTMALRGVEGFDTSEAGAKWLSYPHAKYELSMHGGYPVGPFLGGVFIFGSMREELATPTLVRIANDMHHPHREEAIAILASQVTPASYEALKHINTAGLSAMGSRSIQDMIDGRNMLKPRAQPKLTRAENLRAFEGIVNGDYSAFREMVMKAPDGEVDAVATLKAEDIPLLRRARRASISRCNQHAFNDYVSFTAILQVLVWKYELGKGSQSVAIGN